MDVSQFSYNDLKVLRSIVEEFPENDFELFKTGELLCLKVWFDFDYLKEITTLDLQEGRITDQYAVFNLDRDEELQVNFKKSILTSGDRLFDIVKKPVLSKKKELKTVKLILQVIKDKKLLRKFSSMNKISKTMAIELSKNSYGIFGDQKTASKKKGNDNIIDEEKRDKKVDKDVNKTGDISKRVVESNDDKEKEEQESNDISLEELSEVACKELYFIISYTLGNMRKMMEKKVVDTMVKCIYKYFIKQTINITLEVADIDKKVGKEITNSVLLKCKETGFFNKAKRVNTASTEKTKSTNPYIEFGNNMRPQLAKEHPLMNSKDMLKLIAKMWGERKKE